MIANEEEVLPLQRPRGFHLEWLAPLFYKPRQTISRALERGNSTWIAPLLLLTILALVTILVAGPLRQAAVANGPQTLPPDFQYWSPEQQNQYMQSAAASSGPTYVYVIPFIGELARIWLSWLIFAAILNLLLIIAGTRSDMTMTLNLVAWASLPFAIRYLVQIGSMLITHQVIANPGLAGFAPVEPQGFSLYLSQILPFIDIYLVWMLVLVIVGLLPLSGMTWGKALLCVLISLLILLALDGLPGFLSSQLSGLKTIRPFLF
jgi:hypothetical protein